MVTFKEWLADRDPEMSEGLWGGVKNAYKVGKTAAQAATLAFAPPQSDLATQNLQAQGYVHSRAADARQLTDDARVAKARGTYVPGAGLMKKSMKKKMRG